MEPVSRLIPSSDSFNKVDNEVEEEETIVFRGRKNFSR